MVTQITDKCFTAITKMRGGDARIIMRKVSTLTSASLKESFFLSTCSAPFGQKTNKQIGGIYYDKHII